MAGNIQSSPVHQPGARKGEEMPRASGKEAGRRQTETTGAGRPAGKATPRFASGIVTSGPIDPRSPYLPPA
ncbi:MAG TPA: hypothetical protein VKV37_18980 [Ktedonobacteraceae bacterium]|jgi:hypothetical protein|nr:hypothetical protein [Ktedonobacteraceae bacterium]